MSIFSKSNIGLTVFVIAYNFFLTVISLFWLFTVRFDEIKHYLFGAEWLSSPYAEISYFFFAGIIGASFYCMRSIYQRLGEAFNPESKSRKRGLEPTEIFNIDVWTYWYIYRPIQGGILAIILICLFSQGLLGIGDASVENMESIYFQVGIGFIVGFGAHEVINKLEELIKVLFARSSKESLDVQEKTEKKIDGNPDTKV